jgi:transcriptional regulator with XRE-family HTH domain
VIVEANEPGRLAAQVLKYQREVHRLSLTEVAKLLGATSRNAYARYEQGQAVPSIDKLYELLRIVAPEMALVLAERKPPGEPNPRRRARSGVPHRPRVAKAAADTERLDAPRSDRSDFGLHRGTRAGNAPPRR